jgi:hypothetical protein
VKKKTVLSIFIFIAIISLISISFWANAKIKGMRGLTHMVEGPQGNLFLTVEDYLLEVSPEGNLLSRMHLKNDLGIS